MPQLLALTSAPLMPGSVGISHPKFKRASTPASRNDSRTTCAWRISCGMRQRFSSLQAAIPRTLPPRIHDGDQRGSKIPEHCTGAHSGINSDCLRQCSMLKRTPAEASMYASAMTQDTTENPYYVSQEHPCESRSLSTNCCTVQRGFPPKGIFTGLGAPTLASVCQRRRVVWVPGAARLSAT